MTEFNVSDYFHGLLGKDPNMSPAVAAIQTLLEYIKKPSFGTVSELREKVVHAIDELTKTDSSVISVKSGCEMLLRFITLTALDSENDLEECKTLLLERGNLFLQKANIARQKIAKIACQFVPSGAKILTHSRSRVVLKVLTEACEKNSNIHVYVTESYPDKSGVRLKEELEQLPGINVTLILDSSIGPVMEKIDFVLIGAEGVVESGGIINKIGTSTIGICAKMLNKPVYVAVESFKFVRMYPLNNRDIPDEFKLTDYTHPSFLTLLFTDIGILTPSAVSDELVKLYQ